VAVQRGLKLSQKGRSRKGERCAGQVF